MAEVRFVSSLDGGRIDVHCEHYTWQYRLPASTIVNYVVATNLSAEIDLFPTFSSLYLIFWPILPGEDPSK
jgi:hypothetical protein